MYTTYVRTDAIPTEVTPAVEDSDGPSWFFVVSAITRFSCLSITWLCHGAWA